MITKKVITRTAGMHNIIRIVTAAAGKSRTQCRGWQVRVNRRGIRLSDYFADSKYGGRAASLNAAMHFRDSAVKALPTVPRSEIARRKSARNTSGIPGVRRSIQTVRRGENCYEYVVWTASGSPEPGKRKTRHFYVNDTLNEDDAREAAIAQRLRWEKTMERNERRAPRHN